MRRSHEGTAKEERRRVRTAILILLLSLATIGGLLTAAVLTDTQSVGANTFSVGTVDISTAPASAWVSYSGMAPGDRVTNPITVSNAGSLQLRYAIRSATTEDVLAAQLDMTIKSGVVDCSNAGFGGSGSVLYGPGDLGNSAGLNVVGDPAQGNQAGDRVLDSGASEVLCAQVSLPLTTGSGYEGLTTTATFDFMAEQTANNP
ncbi:MAG: TasA family protein [Actinomycetota bacterium]